MAELTCYRVGVIRDVCVFLFRSKSVVLMVMAISMAMATTVVASYVVFVRDDGDGHCDVDSYGSCVNINNNNNNNNNPNNDGGDIAIARTT